MIVKDSVNTEHLPYHQLNWKNRETVGGFPPELIKQAKLFMCISQSLFRKCLSEYIGKYQIRKDDELSQLQKDVLKRVGIVISLEDPNITR